ncbi:MAG: class I adenylate-forming enzyme family protein [Paracoccaceae bacterium]
MFHGTPIISSFPASARITCLRSGRAFGSGRLAAAVDARAAGLAGQGLRRGDAVVVAESDGADFLIGVFACWAAGLCAVAVSPDLKAEERARVAESTGARAWLGRDAPELPPPAGGPGQASGPLGLDEPALILLTSGTTGVPKGVTHTLRGLSARLALNRAAIGDHALRRTLCVLPVFFGHGLIGNCLTALSAGAALTLWPRPSVAELGGFGDLIDSEAISFFSSVPTFWKIALRVSSRPAAAPERVHVGSAPLGIGTWREIAGWTGTRNIYNMFGMTETANWTGGGALDEADGRDGYVGRAWGGHFAVLCDGGVHADGTGEVLVSSPSVMRGFWGQPEKTREAFHGAWFRSGDIGTLAADGSLVLKGRIKSEINRGGLKVLPEEIDMLLERHRDVAEACAFAIPDPVAGEAVAAAVVLAPGARLGEGALKAWCAERVRAEAVPQRLFFVPALPRNDRGKIVRRAVRDAVFTAGGG